MDMMGGSTTFDIRSALLDTILLALVMGTLNLGHEGILGDEDTPNV